MAALNAAGYDVVIIETVGVGQSETTVANLVDFFLVLLLALWEAGESMGIPDFVLPRLSKVARIFLDHETLVADALARSERVSIDAPEVLTGATA